MCRTDVFALNGINIGGLNYIFLSGDNKILRGKKGSSGVHIVKTVQAVIVSVYDEPIIMAEQCATTIEKLGDYLVSLDY